MCLDRIGPPRCERVAPLKLPPVRDAADLAGTMTAIIAAAGEGAISPNEGGRLARLVEIFLRAVEVHDFERRLQLLENQPLPSLFRLRPRRRGRAHGISTAAPCNAPLRKSASASFARASG